jgi:superoxide dismutase, Fe-Mn family
MNGRLNKLIKLADFIDRAGNVEAANFLDEEITKEAKAGYHKCGLKQAAIDSHTKLYENYKKANDSFQKKHKRLFNGTDNQDSPNMGELREISSGLSHNGNAEFLHKMYFEDIYESSPYPMDKNSGILSIVKDAYDGKIKELEKDIKRMANIPRNGWVTLSYCFDTKKIYLNSFDLHEIGTPVYSMPVLALDMWEHAYFVDFGLDKEAYVDWFLKRIDWRKVSKRIKNYQKVS